MWSLKHLVLVPSCFAQLKRGQHITRGIMPSTSCWTIVVLPPFPVSFQRSLGSAKLRLVTGTFQPFSLKVGMFRTSSLRIGKLQLVSDVFTQNWPVPDIFTQNRRASAKISVLRPSHTMSLERGRFQTFSSKLACSGWQTFQTASNQITRNWQASPSFRRFRSK